jgi:hypothetical protein
MRQTLSDELRANRTAVAFYDPQLAAILVFIAIDPRKGEGTGTQHLRQSCTGLTPQRRLMGALR